MHAKRTYYKVSVLVLTNKLNKQFKATIILLRWSAICLFWKSIYLPIHWFEFCFSQKLLQFLLLYIYNLIPVQLVCPAGGSDGSGSVGGADLAAAVAVDHLTSRLVLSSFTDHFRRPRCSLMMAFPTPPTIWKRILLIFCRHGTVSRISRYCQKIIGPFYLLNQHKL